MEGKHFDQLIKRLGAGTARRRVLGGVIGVTAALLTGAAVLEAKPGKGKAKGKPKVSYCHQTGNGTYRFVTVGAPSGHSKHEGDIPCTPPAECQVATGCDETNGTCTFGPAPVGTRCEVSPGVPGTCDENGGCAAVPVA
jgi:hypothetical protein